jgi:hypothetical protein
MTKYTITLSNAENLALGYVAASQQDWIDNAVHERCRIAIDEIVALAVERCLAAGIQLPGSKDEIVQLAKTQGWLDRQENHNGPN